MFPSAFNAREGHFSIQIWQEAQELPSEQRCESMAIPLAVAVIAE